MAKIGSSTDDLARLLLRGWKQRILGKHPIHLTLFVTSRCNAACEMCFYWERIENPDPDELRLDEMELISRNMPPFPNLLLTGGEPFLRKDLPEICRAFYRNNGVQSLYIPTNGILTDAILKETERILALCPTAMTTIALSLDGIGEDHDRIRGVPGAFRRLEDTAAAIKRLQERNWNLEVIANFTYTAANQDKLEESYRYAKEKMGLKNFNVTLVRGDAKDPGTKEIDIERYDRLTSAIFRDAFRGKNVSRFGNPLSGLILARASLSRKLVARAYREGKVPLRCFASTLNVVISESGEVYPCEMLDVNLGSLRDSDYSLPKILNGSEAKRMREWIRRKNCCCTHECYIPNNILYSFTGLAWLVREWWNLRFGMGR